MTNNEIERLIKEEMERFPEFHSQRTKPCNACEGHNLNNGNVCYREGRDKTSDTQTIKSKGGKNKITTLKEEAKAYVPQQTKNIAELDEVPLDLELFDGEGTDDNGKPFTYKFAELNGEKYRVPGSVIGQLKTQLEANPNLTKCKVKKDGSGLNTRYTVIPIAV